MAAQKMRLNPSDIPEVPVRFMHDVHLEEVGLLNDLYALIEQAEAGNDVPGLEAKVDELLAHAVIHFEGENEKMRELQFPPYPVHRHEHERLLEEFTSVVGQWKQSGELAPLAEYLRETIPAWMMDHISTMDYVTANFFAVHEQ